MSGLLYYLPDRSTVARSEFEQLGLAHLLEPGGPGPTLTGTTRGPDEHAGVVFTLPGVDGHELPATASAAATWSKIDDSPAWVGFLPAARPTPEDLTRAMRITGHEVELADGRRWLVPVARSWRGASRFPRKLARKNGRWTADELLAPYVDLFKAALEVWDELVEKATSSMDLDRATTIAVRALAVNYRVGPSEVAALELLDEPRMVEVLKALADWPSVQSLGNVEASGST